ncbi:two-component sensor histidine kinase [Flavobacterium sp. CYK-4]|uniref:sensor histidine kinase n=1 Tax=Flavobacterium lotistagni TaxID=2709660 RepID=UPI00140C12A9|nr:sensor histidine kinase [Flavobacterium lotistagni]NHM07568.1 two-component sensor histidine kinase [Flavobacterium lotistagni]
MQKYLAILLLFSVCSYAQRFNSLNNDKTFIDSISGIIKSTKNDSIRAYYSFKIADLHRRNKDHEKFQYYLRLGNRYASGSAFLKDVSIYYNALNYAEKGQTDRFAKALRAALGKIRKYRHLQSYKIQVMILQNLSVAELLLDHQRESMRLLTEEAIPVALKTGNPEMLADLYKLIGIGLMNIGDRSKADYYFLRAITEIQKAKYSPVLLENKIELYIIHAENLIYSDRLADGKNYLMKAYTLLKPFPKSNLNGLYYYADGLYFYKTKRYDLALKSYELGLQNCILNRDKQSMNRLQFVKYQAFLALEDYQQAKKVLTELMQTPVLFSVEKMKFYKEMAWVEQQLGNELKAYQYNQKYIAISDSLRATHEKEQVQNLEKKFNQTEKENQIKALEAEKKQNLLLAQYNRMSYVVLGLISLILFLVTLFLVLNSKSLKRIAKQNEINYRQSIDALKYQKTFEIMQAAILGEEAERKRIARDLHDGIGSRLSALKMQLQSLKSQPDSNPAWSRFSDSLSLSIAELRQIAFNLLPETLIKLGLELALKDLCHSQSNSKTAIVFHANSISDQIASNDQLSIFRIVQELINNALKHARCTEIIVDCSQNQELFLITVEDDGIGFDLKALDNFSGLGIKNIKNRVELLKGNVEIISHPDQGSIFNISITLNTETS